jgi:hypothetical protein
MRRRHIALAVVYAEPMVIKAELAGLGLCHFVKNLDTAGGSYQRTCSAPVVNRSFIPVGLADMMLQLNG